MNYLTKMQEQAFIARLLEVASYHTIGAKTRNGKLTSSQKVFDYEIDGEQKSLYVDWRNEQQMKKGLFSYSNEFMITAKEHYSMVVIANTSNPFDMLRWFPDTENDSRFSISYLEDEKEPIYTIKFDNPEYRNRYE